VSRAYSKNLFFLSSEFYCRFEDPGFARMVEGEDDGPVGGESGTITAAVLNGFDFQDEGTIFLPAFRFRRIQLDDVREIFSFHGLFRDVDRQVGQFDLAKGGAVPDKDDERGSAFPKESGKGERLRVGSPEYFFHGEPHAWTRVRIGLGDLRHDFARRLVDEVVGLDFVFRFAA